MNSPTRAKGIEKSPFKKEEDAAIGSGERMLGGEGWGGRSIQKTRIIIYQSQCVCGGGGKDEEVVVMKKVNQ